MNNGGVQGCGVIYLAFGAPYLAIALRSIRSLRETNPGLPVCLVTNCPVEASQIDLLDPSDSIVVLEESQARNRSIKTSINKISPFERTVFLDCDTVVMGSLANGFRFLDNFDLAFRLNPYPQTRKGKADIKIMEGLTVGDCPHWNSGVMFFAKRPETDLFFERWNQNFEALENGYDQVSLVKTIFEDRGRVLSLDIKWNASDTILGRKKWRRQAKVFHYASNISNRLSRELLHEAETMKVSLEGIVQDTQNFINRKRAQKKGTNRPPEICGSHGTLARFAAGLM